MMHMMKKATKIPSTTTTTAITASFWVPFSENINAVILNLDSAIKKLKGDRRVKLLNSFKIIKTIEFQKYDIEILL